MKNFERRRWFDELHPRCFLDNGHYVDIWDTAICDQMYQPVINEDMPAVELESFFDNVSQKNDNLYR